MTAVDEVKKQLVLDYCELRMGQITRGDVHDRYSLWVLDGKW